MAAKGQQVLRQREWTEEELIKGGFSYYEPVKRLVMAKIVTNLTQVAVTLEVLTVNSGDVMIYSPGDEAHEKIDDYDHWPIKRGIFMKNYASWDEPGWKPTPIQRQFLEDGCLPYYRTAGVWALKLPISIYMQTLESPEPIVVPKGRWLLIGSQGEPYSQSDEDFYERYQVPAHA